MYLSFLSEFTLSANGTLICLLFEIIATTVAKTHVFTRHYYSVYLRTQTNRAVFITFLGKATVSDAIDVFRPVSLIIELNRCIM